MTFRTLLKRYMKENELSANQTASDLMTTRRNILYWKSGSHKPPDTKVDNLLLRMGFYKYVPMKK